MAAELTGWCPHCGDPARGTGGTTCWRCQKYRQRHGCYPTTPKAERLTAQGRLREAALLYADAEDDLAYARADRALDAASLARAAELGWRPPSARRPVAPSALPLLEWARVRVRCVPHPRLGRFGPRAVRGSA